VSSSSGNLKHLVENSRVFEGNVIKHKYSLSISKNETPALAPIFQNARHFFFSFLETPNEYLPNTRWISHKYLFIYVLFYFCLLWHFALGNTPLLSPYPTLPGTFAILVVVGLNFELAIRAITQWAICWLLGQAHVLKTPWLCGPQTST
jgi:hypothetical protein